MMHATEALNKTIINRNIRQANFEIDILPKAIKLIEDEIKEAMLFGKTYVVIRFNDDFKKKTGFNFKLASWTEEGEQAIFDEVKNSGYKVERFDSRYNEDTTIISWAAGSLEA